MDNTTQSRSTTDCHKCTKFKVLFSLASAKTMGLSGAWKFGIENINCGRSNSQPFLKCYLALASHVVFELLNLGRKLRAINGLHGWR